MSETISLRDHAQSTAKISKHDFDVLIAVLQKPLKRELDIFEGIRLLKDNNTISEETYGRLIEKFEGLNGSFRTAFQHFVMEAVVLVGMENLIMLMRRMKCFDIANMLIHAKNGIVVEILVGQSMGVSEEILKYHSRLKTDMDNNVFADRKLEFERRAKELVASFSRIADLEEKNF